LCSIHCSIDGDLEVVVTAITSVVKSCSVLEGNGACVSSSHYWQPSQNRWYRHNIYLLLPLEQLINQGGTTLGNPW